MGRSMLRSAGPSTTGITEHGWHVPNMLTYSYVRGTIMRWNHIVERLSHKIGERLSCLMEGASVALEIEPWEQASTPGNIRAGGKLLGFLICALI